MKKRIISGFLSLMLLVSMVISSFAAELETGNYVTLSTSSAGDEIRASTSGGDNNIIIFAFKSSITPDSSAYDETALAAGGENVLDDEANPIPATDWRYVKAKNATLSLSGLANAEWTFTAWDETQTAVINRTTASNITISNGKIVVPLSVSDSSAIDAGWTVGTAITKTTIGTITGGTAPYTIDESTKSTHGLTVAVEGSNIVVTGTPDAVNTRGNISVKVNDNDSGTVTQNVTLPVINKGTLYISADPSTATVTASKNIDISGQIKVTVGGTSGSAAPTAAYSLGWASDATSYATVDAGVVSGVSAGVANITATMSLNDSTNYELDSTTNARVAVTVSPGTAVTLDPATTPIEVTVIGTTSDTVSTHEDAIQAELAKIKVKDGSTILTGTWATTNGSTLLSKFGPNASVATYTWTYTSGGSNAPYATATMAVTVNLQKQLAISDFATTGITKTYDAGTALPTGGAERVALTAPVNDGVDIALTVTVAGAYTDASAGSGNKTVTVSGLTPYDVGTTTNANWEKYYALPAVPASITNASITAKSLTVAGASNTISSTAPKVSDLLSSSDLAAGETIATANSNAFATGLTFEAGSTVSDHKWTATAGGSAIEVVFYEPGTADTADATKRLAANTFELGKAYPFTITVAAKSDFGSYDLQALTVPGGNAMSGTLTLKQQSSGGGGTTSYKVSFNVGDNGKISKGNASAYVNSGSKLTESKIPTVTANDGYKFIGWSLDSKTVVDPTVAKVTKAVTYTALYEKTGEQPVEPSAEGFAKDRTASYMNGYPDGTFRPQAGITRGEVSAIIARTILPEFPADGSEVPSYNDLSGHWASKYIGYLESLGVVTGYPDGSFKPDQTITRSEFVAIVIRVDGLVNGTNTFTDVSDSNWATKYIIAAVEKAYVSGYPDGTFRPEQPITRTEAAKIMNAVLGWADMAADGQMKFNDVATDFWGWNDILKASNGVVA